MTQIHILHALSAKAEAQAFTLGLQKEGYVVYWDQEYGGMTVLGSDAASRAACVIALWTRGSRCSKWVMNDAIAAEERSTLVEVTLESVESPFRSDLAPLDFANWDGKPEGPLWKALVDRVRATCGRPTGKLPLKEQAQPALLIVGVTVATVSGLVSGTLPQADVKEAMLSVGYEQLAPETAMGGPMLSPVDLTMVEPYPLDFATVTFEPMTPFAAPTLAAMDAVGVFQNTDMASVDDAADLIPSGETGAPVL